MSITLYTNDVEGPRETFTESVTNLTADNTFRKALVTAGQWILYKQINYNDASLGGTANDYKILDPTAEAQDISCLNGSLYLVPSQEVGIVLFEHSFYGGKRQRYDDPPACPDVTTVFPDGQIGGVSSTIVLTNSSKWDVFSQKVYKGVHNMLLPGKYYATPAEMKFPNDRVMSIRKK